MVAHPARATPTRSRGLSLLEIMLALVILAVAYLPLSELFHLTSQETVKSRNYLIAQHLAQGLFELYRVQPNTILKVLAGEPKPRVADALGNAGLREVLTGRAREIDDVIRFSNMTMAVEVELSVEKRPGLHRIDTTLRWQEDGRERSRTFARLVCH